jgi:cell division protein FtsI (penicillin-binding protein 3)
LFKNNLYHVAGKTGTALVANGRMGYADKIYQSSFAGYFPAENPQYTCIVVIKNKPHAAIHFGADVAGPVFKEIADRLYSTFIRQTEVVAEKVKRTDSSAFLYTGNKKDINLVSSKLNIRYADSSKRMDDWIDMIGKNAFVVANAKTIHNNTMPELKGMGLKDVVYLCENMGLKLNAKGKGKVAVQSIQAGQPIAKGQLINIELY